MSMHYYRHSLTYVVVTSGRSVESHIFHKSELGMHAVVYARVSS